GPLIDVAGAQCLDGCSNLVSGVVRPPWRGGDTDRLTAIDCQPLAFCYRSVHSRLQSPYKCSEKSARRLRANPRPLLWTAKLTFYQFWHQLAHDGVDFWEGSCRVLPLFGRLPAGGSGPSGAVHRAEDPQRVGLGLAGPCPQQQNRRIVRVELVPE